MRLQISCLTVGVVLMGLLISCSGPSNARNSKEADSVLTIDKLTDGERVWCQKNLKKLLPAAKILGIEPLAVIQSSDPKYAHGPGASKSKNASALFSLMDDIDQANGSPAVLRQKYWPGTDVDFDPESERWPSYTMGYVTAYDKGPWVWYSAADFPRACRAAYEAR